MSEKWTGEQLSVINSRKQNMLVSASAGSGKTAVLTEHIISLIADEKNDTGIEDLLIVTFTRAATAEMRERISSALDEFCRRDPGNRRLFKQRALVENADIMTIDAFCAGIVRSHFELTDIDPGFREGEKAELEIMKKEVMKEMFADRLENGDEAFRLLADTFNAKKFEQEIADRILTICEAASNEPDAGAWINMCVSMYDISTRDELLKSGIPDFLNEHINRRLASYLGSYKQALKEIGEHPELEAYEAAFKREENLIEKLLRSGYFRSGRIVRDFEFEKLGQIKRAGGGGAKEAGARVRSMRDDFKKYVKKLKSGAYMDEEQILSQIRESRESIRTLAGLSLEFTERLKKAKAEKNITEFSDVSHAAYDILVERVERGRAIPTKAAKEVAGRYKEILIDEYQDGNRLQEHILTSIANGRGYNNMFMVGDVKQSIYGFRQAEPQLFTDKYEKYSTNPKASKRKASLNANFRSRREIVDSVNAMFSRFMLKELGGVDYEKDARLVMGADYPETPAGQSNSTEITFFLNSLEKSGSVRYEACRIAEKIRELTDPAHPFMVWDRERDGYRPVRFKDIVILKRTNSNTRIYSDVFERAHIPLYCPGQGNFLKTTEISAMLSLFKVIINPLDDIPLAALMRSGMFNFSATDLARIRSENRCFYLYESVAEYETTGEDPALREKIAAFTEKLDGYRRMAPFLSTYELAVYLLDDTGYCDFVSSLDDGDLKRKNLELFCEKAHEYDEGSYRGLFKFVKYIENIEKTGHIEDEAGLYSEKDDIVRLTTVHKSKGLQFPVVILAECGKQFNFGRRSAIRTNRKFGIGTDLFDSRLKTKTATFFKMAIDEANELDEIAEEMRILYVAMTRAKEKLFVFGTIGERQLPDNPEKFKGTGRYNAILNCRSYAGWILNAAGQSDPSDSCIRLLVEKADDDLDPGKVLSALEKEAKASEGRADGRGEEKDTASYRSEKEDAASSHGENEDESRGRMLPPEEEKKGEFKYPFEADTRMPTKTSVTNLKKRSERGENADYGYDPLDDGVIFNEETELNVPAFAAENQPAAGADRGTAYHRVFEILDYSRGSDPDSISEMLLSFRASGMIDEETFKAVRPADILRFLNSPLGRRMKAAHDRGALYRERPYLVGLNADSIDPECSHESLVVVQGIIDACFEEDGGMVIVDYKTDNVKTGDELKKRYHAQLNYYAAAIEQVMGMRVKEKIIYSVKLGEAITLG